MSSIMMGTYMFSFFDKKIALSADASLLMRAVGPQPSMVVAVAQPQTGMLCHGVVLQR